MERHDRRGNLLRRPAVFVADLSDLGLRVRRPRHSSRGYSDGVFANTSWYGHVRKILGIGRVGCCGRRTTAAVSLNLRWGHLSTGAAADRYLSGVLAGAHRICDEIMLAARSRPHGHQIRCSTKAIVLRNISAARQTMG